MRVCNGEIDAGSTAQKIPMKKRLFKQPGDRQWVEDTLAGMSIEEQVAQLLIPSFGHDYARFETIINFHKSHGLGGVFVNWSTPENHVKHLVELQKARAVPLVVAADLECGAGSVVQGGVQFPDLLALAAADEEECAYTMGKAAALEGRRVGIHWTYAPVVDVNRNPDNPVTCTRSLGDNTERVIRLGRAMIRGLQDHGLAACMKHFPGDGMDDLDQHVSTSVNSLSIADWWRISGRAFREVMEADPWSAMIGHIAFPARDPERDRRGAYRPATLSRRIITDLLRGELGYDGLVVSDAMHMGGVCGYMNRRDRTIAVIASGCDMLLFPELPEDYETLVEAVSKGILSRERLAEAVQRVLEMKVRLGLHEGALFGREATAEELRVFQATSRHIPEKAVHKARDIENLLPLHDLAPGARVLPITLSSVGADLPEVDEELRRRGFEVSHRLNPEDSEPMLFKTLSQYDAVFVNFVFKAAPGTNSVRSVGWQNRTFYGGWYMDHPRAVFTSFGSPYHLRVFNTLPNYINVHSNCPDSQRAAVAAWFGEIPMRDHGPVANLVR